MPLFIFLVKNFIFMSFFGFWYVFDIRVEIKILFCVVLGWLLLGETFLDLLNFGCIAEFDQYVLVGVSFFLDVVYILQAFWYLGKTQDFVFGEMLLGFAEFGCITEFAQSILVGHLCFWDCELYLDVVYILDVLSIWVKMRFVLGQCWN